MIAGLRRQAQLKTAARFGAQLSKAFAGLHLGLRTWVERIRPIAEELARAGALPRPPRRESPGQRALRLIRERNTGPAARRRPPRRVDPTRARR